MTQAIETILSQLNEVFAPLDEKFIANSIIWSADRVEALIAFKQSDEYQSIKKDAYRLYDRLYAIAGGKTWYSIFYGRNKSMIEEFVTKNCNAIIKKRNLSITAKLIKAGVTEVLDSTYTRSNDGFRGVFVVMTDSGKKWVTIDTIVAGGYNIQCVHNRTLVKVR